MVFRRGGGNDKSISHVQNSPSRHLQVGERVGLPGQTGLPDRNVRTSFHTDLGLPETKGCVSSQGNPCWDRLKGNPREPFVGLLNETNPNNKRNTTNKTTTKTINGKQNKYLRQQTKAHQRISSSPLNQPGLFSSSLSSSPKEISTSKVTKPH